MSSKKYNYIITLKEPGYKWVDRVSILLCFLSSLLFMYFIITGYFQNENRTVIICVIALLIVAAQFGFNYVNRHTHITNNRIAFLAIAVTWVLLNNIWLAALYLLAAILEPKIKFPDEIGFDDEGITKNTLLKKSYLWQELSNVILKDDILTVDFKDNSILQKETEKEVDDTTEKEFNMFCREKLSAFSNSLTATVNYKL